MVDLWFEGPAHQTSVRVIVHTFRFISVLDCILSMRDVEVLAIHSVLKAGINVREGPTTGGYRWQAIHNVVLSTACDFAKHDAELFIDRLGVLL